MRHAPHNWIFALAALMLAGLACQITASAPDSGAPTGGSSGATPTTNLTLTAVFANSATPLVRASATPPNGTPTLAELPASPLPQQAAPTLTPAQSGGGQGTPTVLQPQSGITPIVLDFSPSATPTPGESNEEAEENGEEEPAAANRRPGPAIEAAYLSQPPSVDGDLSDFPANVYLLNTAVAGGGFSSGDKDISAQARFGWDATFLYIGVRVFDNKFVQTASGPQLWRGDSLELLLDADLADDFNSRAISGDDYQLGLSPGDLLTGGLPEAFLWTPLGKVGVPQGVQIAAGLTADGYLMEIAIPWVLFEATPGGGAAFGFLLSVSDNDDPTANRQQTVVSFAPGRALHDPTTWRTLILLEP